MAMRGILGNILYVAILFKLISVFLMNNIFYLFHSEILVSIFGFHITLGEMKILTGKQWVNDVVMRLFYKYMYFRKLGFWFFFFFKLTCVWIDTIGNWHGMSCAK